MVLENKQSSLCTLRKDSLARWGEIPEGADPEGPGDPHQPDQQAVAWTLKEEGVGDCPGTPTASTAFKHKGHSPGHTSPSQIELGAPWLNSRVGLLPLHLASGQRMGLGLHLEETESPDR